MKTQKRITLVLVVLFLISIFLMRIYVIAEADHDCSGEHCPICETIAHIIEVEKELCTVVFTATILFVFSFIFVKTILVNFQKQIHYSLVKLKVQLLC